MRRPESTIGRADSTPCTYGDMCPVAGNPALTCLNDSWGPYRERRPLCCRRLDKERCQLAYDQDGTWSLKYNGYADTLLKLGLVPASVARTEAAWYLSHAATDGVPLDIRQGYTKADWEMWAAAWLKDHDEIRDLLIAGLYKFVDTSAQRVPMTDWYDAVTGRQQGFQARPVVGGFLALLTVT